MSFGSGDGGDPKKKGSIAHTARTFVEFCANHETNTVLSSGKNTKETMSWCGNKLKS